MLSPADRQKTGKPVSDALRRDMETLSKDRAARPRMGLATERKQPPALLAGKGVSLERCRQCADAQIVKITPRRKLAQCSRDRPANRSIRGADMATVASAASAPRLLDDGRWDNKCF